MSTDSTGTLDGVQRTRGLALRDRLRAIGRSVGSPHVWVLASALLILVFLTLTPLAYLLGQVLLSEDGAIAAFQRAFDSYHFPTLLMNSLAYASGAAILSTVVGTVLAYMAERTDTPSAGSSTSRPSSLSSSRPSCTGSSGSGS
jgi:ABC-type spermidine/putrescine transport system permease subunit I